MTKEQLQILPEQIAQETLDWLTARTNLTLGTRAEFKQFLTRKIQPLSPAQTSLSFDDEKALKGQSEAILKLLKQRGSLGAPNHELAGIALNYRARISELRQGGWKIPPPIRQGASRTFVYRLAPTDWEYPG